MSQYAAEVYEEILSIRNRVGLKLAKLHRAKVKHFDREPPTVVDRRYYSGEIVEWIKAQHVIITKEQIEAMDEEGMDRFMQCMVMGHLVEEHFKPQMEALEALVARVLEDPKHKYLRHALRLPKASTPQQYQANLQESMFTLFAEGDENEDFQRLAPAWLERRATSKIITEES